MYNWNKKIVTWRVGKTLYLSVVFSWQLEEAQKIADEWKGKAIMGGPAMMQPNECLNFSPIQFHNPCATFTTRGCPNKCGFCAVPKLEGEFEEIKNFKPAPLICDNNFLASSMEHIKRVVDAIKSFPFVDFNQGLDARLFTKEKALSLGSLKCKVRFAFDNINLESKVKDAIDLCKKYTTKDIGVYCLIGFNDTPEEAIYKLDRIRSWDVLPNPMRYQPLNARFKNEYIYNTWTEGQLKAVMRYYSRLNWLGHIPFSEYKNDPQQGNLFEDVEARQEAEQ